MGRGAKGCLPTWLSHPSSALPGLNRHRPQELHSPVTTLDPRRFSMKFVMASCPTSWTKKGLENRKDWGAPEQPPHAGLATPLSCFNQPICTVIPLLYSRAAFPGPDPESQKKDCLPGNEGDSRTVPSRRSLGSQDLTCSPWLPTLFLANTIYT